MVPWNCLLQTANRTKELAANTLEELQRQGDKLEVIDQDLHAVRTSLLESERAAVLRIWRLQPE